MNDTTDKPSDKPSLEEIAQKDTAATTSDKGQPKDSQSKPDDEKKPAADPKVGPNAAPKPVAKSSGGFVWVVLLLVIAGGSVAAGWPFIGPRVEPVIADVRDLLGLTPRPTQAQMPTDSPVYAPPVVEAPITPPSPAQPQAPDEAPHQETMDTPPAEPTAPMVADTPQAPAVDVADDMAERLSVLENQIQTLSSMSGGEGQAAVEATADLARALSGLKNEIAVLSQRLSALEDRSRADPTAPAQALVLGVTQLRSQLLGDGAFAAELQALESIAGSDQTVMDQIQRLRPHAEVGLPTEAALTARFTKVAKAIVTARTSSEAGGWLDAVKDGLGGLVTVRRTDPAAITDQVERAVAVAEAALELGELADAVEALSALEGAPSEVAAAWLGDARARVDAETALQALHRHALSVLAAAGGA